MTVSLVIVLIVLGQIYLALFYFSKENKSVKKIRKKSKWPRNLKYSIPLFSWIIYLNLFNTGYSLLTEYSKLILIVMIILTIILRYVKSTKKRTVE